MKTLITLVIIAFLYTLATVTGKAWLILIGDTLVLMLFAAGVYLILKNHVKRGRR